MRLLLIAFYFPPTGGGGVQRVLKFCRYLPDHGVEVHVLAPDDSKWFARDEPLLDAIPETTRVHRCRFVGPRASSRADDLHAARGVRRLAVEARHAYTRALVPDKVVSWIATAVPAGIRVVRRENIDVIMTTSPPSSVHLVGEAVAAATGRPWVADFRDSWLHNPHRRYDHAGVRAKGHVIARMARSVATRTTAMTAVTGAIAQELAGLHPSAAGKTSVIENGADFDDFEGHEYTPGERFVIVHAGAFFGERSPRVFLLALRSLLDRRPDLRGRVLARFVGDLRAADRDWARELGIDGAWEETGFLPFAESVAAQRSADALLLLIPHAGGRGDTVLSGKVYEYLAARRPILAVVPPAGAAANLIRSVSAGEVVASDDEPAVSQALEALVDRWHRDGLGDVVLPVEAADRLSRRSRARELATVLREAVR